MAAYDCYKLYASEKNTFVLHREEEEKALGSGDLGIEDNECDPKEKINFINDKDLDQLSDESYIQAQNDLDCAKYLMNRGSQFSSQAV